MVLENVRWETYIELADQRRGCSGCTRARCPDHPDHLWVGHYRLRTRLATFCRAEVVETGTDLHRMAGDLAVVGDGQLDAPLVGDAQRRVGARDDVQRSNLDGLAGLHHHLAEGAGLGCLAPVVAAGGGDQREGEEHGK